MARDAKKKDKAGRKTKKRDRSNDSKQISKKPAKTKPSKPKTPKKPTRPTKPEAVTASVKPSRKRRWRWAIFKLALFLLILACLIPTVFTYVYRSSSINPVSTLMISRWISGEPVTRSWVPLEKISPFVIQSVISSEDGKFCAHEGVDWDAVNLVVDDLIEGERPRGASTIPMQTVKNLYLWSSRSYVRKGLEVPLALLVDKVWSKKRLLEIYLNIAEWGPGIFGVEAAARHHFKRSAKSLNRKQAALLAVTLPNPILRNPRKPGKGMRRLAQLVERRARQSGAYIKCVR